MNKKLQIKILKIACISLYIFSLWSVWVFWMKASGYIDHEWLAFNLDSTHFWNRGFLYLLFITTWFYISGKKNLYKNDNDRYASLLFLLLGITLDNIGNLFGFYRTDTQYGIEWYDKFVHFVNSSFTTLFFFVTLRNIFRKSALALVCVAAIGISVLVGTLFEIGEYYSDLMSDTTMVSGVADVIIDSAMNVCGSLVGGIIAVTVVRKR